MDSTSAAPPTAPNADPVTVTCTLEPVNWPGSLASVEAMPLGDVGEEPPQAEKSVATVAQDAAWHAPAQNRRRETGAFASVIVILMRAGQWQKRNIRATPQRPGFS